MFILFYKLMQYMTFSSETNVMCVKYMFLWMFSFGLVGMWAMKNKTVLATSVFCATLIEVGYYAITYYFNFYLDYKLICILELLLTSFFIYFQFKKKYKFESSDVNSKNVCLGFYKVKSFSQIFKSSGAYPVCSMCLFINNKMYRYQRAGKTLQERDYTKEYVEKSYIVIDTGFKSKKLKGDWRTELLKEKARDYDRLWLRFRCVKSLKYVLKQLPKKWRYEFTDLLSSIYLIKRY